MLNYYFYIKLTDYDFIINCAGVGSSQLLNDAKLLSVRGHCVKVKAPWIKHCISTGKIFFFKINIYLIHKYKYIFNIKGVNLTYILPV